MRFAVPSYCTATREGSRWQVPQRRALLSVLYLIQAQGQINCEPAELALIPLAPPHIILGRNKRPHLGAPKRLVAAVRSTYCFSIRPKLGS